MRRPSDRHIRWSLSWDATKVWLIALGLTFAALGVLIPAFGHNRAVDECRRLYARARTAADTVVVDLTAPAAGKAPRVACRVLRERSGGPPPR